MRRSQNVLLAGLVGALAGCGNLTCDQSKHKSIEHANAGVEAMNSRSFDKASKELEQAVTIDPENHVAAYNLGMVYIQMKEYDKAADAFEQAVKYNDEDAMYHYHLGKAYLLSEKLDMAQKELERAVELEPRLFKAHFHLGEVHAKKDRPKEAAEAWTQAAKLNPSFGKPFFELGKLYYLWDYHQEAIQVLQAGTQAKDAEDLTDIYYQLGMAYESLTQHDKAVEAYKSAIAERADNLQAKLRLGMVYAEKGDKDNARKYLEEFVKQGGGNDSVSIQAANQRLLQLAVQ